VRPSAAPLGQGVNRACQTLPVGAAACLKAQLRQPHLSHATHTRLLAERCRILPIGHGNHQRQRLVRWHVGVSWAISVISAIAVIAVTAVISDAIDLQAPSGLQAARCTTCITRPAPNEPASIEAAWLVAMGSML